MARRSAVHDQIICKKAPKPVGPYVHAVRVKNPGETLYISGQIPIELPGGNIFKGDIKRQAELALNHLRNIVLDAGFSMDEIVKCTIFLTDMGNFGAVNEVYQRYFTGFALPARVVVEVSGLPKDVGIEVEAIGMKAGVAADEMF